MRQLDKEKIRETITTVGIGVLSMISEEEPYGIPVSFGYDDGDVSFILQTDRAAESRKLAALSINPHVCLTVVQQSQEPTEVWRSVVMTGKLIQPPLDDEKAAVDALADNGSFVPGVNVFDAPESEIDITIFQLDITEMSGREFGGTVE